MDNDVCYIYFGCKVHNCKLKKVNNINPYEEHFPAIFQFLRKNKYYHVHFLTDELRDELRDKLRAKKERQKQKVVFTKGRLRQKVFFTKRFEYESHV